MRRTSYAADVASLFRSRFLRDAGSLPSFLVIGTRRGGSTSLYESIVQHPAVVRSRMKKGSHYFDVNHRRGWEWFRSCFPVVPAGMITGEASPYYMFHPLAPRRIAKELPEVRLIAVLRNPVDRAYSHYQFERREYFEDLPFEEALDREEDRLYRERERMLSDPRYESFPLRHHSYLARGKYAEQLEEFHRQIPDVRILVLQSEALRADPSKQLGKVWRFLELEPYVGTVAQRAKQAQYPPLPAATRNRLERYFRPHNERLYAMPDVDFRWDEETAQP